MIATRNGEASFVELKLPANDITGRIASHPALGTHWNPRSPGNVWTCMRKLSLPALVLFVGLSVSACDIQAGENGHLSFDIAQGKATDTWSRTYKIEATGRFELININGRVTATPTDGTDVIVEGRRSAKGRSDE